MVTPRKCSNRREGDATSLHGIFEPGLSNCFTEIIRSQTHTWLRNSLTRTLLFNSLRLSRLCWPKTLSIYYRLSFNYVMLVIFLEIPAFHLLYPNKCVLILLPYSFYSQYPQFHKWFLQTTQSPFHSAWVLQHHPVPVPFHYLSTGMHDRGNA